MPTFVRACPHLPRSLPKSNRFLLFIFLFISLTANAQNTGLQPENSPFPPSNSIVQQFPTRLINIKGAQRWARVALKHIDSPIRSLAFKTLMLGSQQSRSAYFFAKSTLPDGRTHLNLNNADQVEVLRFYEDPSGQPDIDELTTNRSEQFLGFIISCLFDFNEVNNLFVWNEEQAQLLLTLISNLQEQAPPKFFERLWSSEFIRLLQQTYLNTGSSTVFQLYRLGILANWFTKTADRFVSFGYWVIHRRVVEQEIFDLAFALGTAKNQNAVIDVIALLLVTRLSEDVTMANSIVDPSTLRRLERQQYIQNASHLLPYFELLLRTRVFALAAEAFPYLRGEPKKSPLETLALKLTPKLVAFQSHVDLGLTYIGTANSRRSEIIETAISLDKLLVELVAIIKNSVYFRNLPGATNTPIPRFTNSCRTLFN